MGGARQVGKTYLIKEFGRREFASTIYLNFEEDPALDSLFAGRLAPERLLQSLSRYGRQPITPGATLIVLDEIQQSNRALNSLKYFAEQAPEQHVVAAGSLLGVQLSKPGSFPVGKVNTLQLYPLTFAEFLDACGDQPLLDELEEASIAPLPEVFHRALLERLRSYFFVGGMPEAVAVYVDTADVGAVSRVHKELLVGYQADFGKHAPGEMVPKLNLLWSSIPAQLARENKKFVYSALHRGARARGYEDGLAWLAGAGLIHRCQRASVPEVPLASSVDPNAFKVYLHDVGLLGALAGTTSTNLASDELFSAFRGAFVENYVAQELAARDLPLHYWRSKATAEVDFLLSLPGVVLPLEAKAGINPRSKSLRVYDELYQPPALLRTTALNRRHDGKICNIPLYALNGLATAVGLCLEARDDERH